MSEGRHAASGASDLRNEPAGDTPHEPLDWPAKAGAVVDVLREVQVRLQHRRRRRVRIAAAMMLTLVAGGFTWLAAFRRSASEDHPSSPSTVLISPARQTLADGSVIELRNDAKITVAFTGAFRRVLLARGEAHFQVAKNPLRPFIVSAGGVEFRAVGTAFAVSLGEEKVEILVTEGRVSVDRAEADSTAQPSTGSRTLSVVEAGNRVVVDVAAPQYPIPIVSAVSASELTQRLAWRAPKLEFSGTPLPEAIEMINRQTGSESKLRLGDPALGSIRLTGVLRADNVNTLIDVLAADYGIKAERQEHADIVLRKGR